MIDTLEMSAQEMVEWANANLERVAALENEIERLTDRNEEVEREIEVFIAINKHLRAALESIAKNTCCESCQEARLVALAALETAK